MATLYPELPETLSAARNVLNVIRAGTIGDNIPRFVKDVHLCIGGVAKLSLGDPDATAFNTQSLAEEDRVVLVELAAACNTPQAMALRDQLIPLLLPLLAKLLERWLTK